MTGKKAMAPTPRSLILDLFGDYFRYSNGEVRLGALSQLLNIFNIEASSTRVTMSRLKKEGWFSTRREGRETIYTLSESMMQVLVDGRERIFQREDDTWGGRWTMVLYQVPEAARPTRDALRKNLAWLGFGQLSPSVWLAAHDRMAPARQLIQRHPKAEITVLWSGTESITDDRGLAEQCWDLQGLAEDYERFISNYQMFDDPKQNAVRPGHEAVELRTLLVGEARRFAFRDPELPKELEPANWPGREAYALFRRLHAQLAPQAIAHVEAAMGTPFVTSPPLEM
ncbi:PaaX family transcriptional regulator [Arthrobacter sp. D2-10]